MTIECTCGYTCGTELAFVRHASRFPSGEHTKVRMAPSASSSTARDEQLEATWRLVAAAEMGNIDAVRAALDAGANVDGTDREHERDSDKRITWRTHPLTASVVHGHRRVAELLLSRRSSILVDSWQIYEHGWSRVKPLGTLPAAYLVQPRGTVARVPNAPVLTHGRHLQMASMLLTHTASASHTARMVSHSVTGPRKEIAAGERMRANLCQVLGDLWRVQSAAISEPSAPTASDVFAMLVADGHLQAVEPQKGMKALARRLAGKPSDWLAAQLTATRGAVCEKMDEELLWRANSTHASRLAMTRLREQIDLCLAQGPRPRWTPRAHHHYPDDFRRCVFTVLLCANRLASNATPLGSGAANVESIEHGWHIGKLPKEVLLILVEWLAEVTFWTYDRGESESILRLAAKSYVAVVS